MSSEQTQKGSSACRPRASCQRPACSPFSNGSRGAFSKRTYYYMFEKVTYLAFLHLLICGLTVDKQCTLKISNTEHELTEQGSKRERASSNLDIKPFLGQK